MSEGEEPAQPEETSAAATATKSSEPNNPQPDSESAAPAVDINVEEPEWMKQFEKTFKEFKLTTKAIDQSIKDWKSAVSKLDQTDEDTTELQRDLLTVHNQCWIYEPMVLEPAAVKEYSLFFDTALMAEAKAQQLSDHVNRLAELVAAVKSKRVTHVLRCLMNDLDEKVTALEARTNDE